ncbi:hypothetical protein [Pseudarthrobacter sp. WHRI 8279]|uniref:hypothetical protein n=1 Tax=Pseudarthrobacter sp. WHRI 8279 TaxID=3162566 RepID=UPI0035A91A07
MNDYSGCMKSQDAAALLRKLVEMVAQDHRSGAMPQERFYPEYALLGFPTESGWAIGIRMEVSENEWSVTEILALPGEATQGLPDLSTPAFRSYLDEAATRAKGRRSAMNSYLESTRANAEFIQSRFETWRSKAAPRRNVEYAALAAKYAEQIREGNTKATATLAEQVGMSPSVMAQRIKEARRRLLLTRGEQGRASGTLTPLGALYTDPDFPGMREVWKSGLGIRAIADKYGVDERSVWVAMEEERTDSGVPVPLDEFIASSGERR